MPLSFGRNFSLLLSITALIAVSPTYAAPGNCQNCAIKTCIARALYSVLEKPTPGAKIEYEGVAYEIARLSDEGFTLKAARQPPVLQEGQQPQVIQTIGKKFDFKNFDLPREPLPVQNLRDKQGFSRPGSPRVLELPIKVPGSDYKVPRELEQFREAIQAAIDKEAAINPNVRDYYAYLTVDQGTVKAGTTQRRGGTHVDGFQGVRQDTKYEIDHSYIVSDAVPTVFYRQPFETRHLDEGAHNFFTEMDRQAYELAEIETKPYQVYLMDAYSLHRAQPAAENTNRTILRITYSRHRYDRLGETDNPLFPAWQRTERFIPSNLKPFTPKDASEFTGHGFVPETEGLGLGIPHTLKKPEDYMRKQLGEEVIQALVAKRKPIFVAVGDVPSARELATQYGWKIENEVSKEEGFHRIFRARHTNGQEGFVLLRVNSPERLTHIHSLLRLAGADARQVYTAGRVRSWKTEILSNLRTRSQTRPDGVFYGFPNSVIDAVLKAHPSNQSQYEKIADIYKLRHRPIGLNDHEMSNLWVSELELTDGRKFWFMPNLYGSMAKDAFEAVREIQPKQFVYLGTAGASDPSLKVGQVISPTTMIKVGAEPQTLAWVGTLPGVQRRGQYESVPTFLIETQKWAEDARRRGTSLVEVEYEHALNTFRSASATKFSSGLVVSDVLTGPGHRDISEWTYQDNKGLVPLFKKIVGGTLGNAPTVKSFRWFPLVDH